jgi:hypothetical protein
MTRPLRVGDRVTATGTVTDVSGSHRYTVKFDGDAMYRNGLPPEALTLIEPAEPPVGSVVVKDGVAWTRYHARWYTESVAEGVGPRVGKWRDLDDGEVIFTPGGDA